MKDIKNVFQKPVKRKLVGVQVSNVKILFCRPIPSFFNISIKKKQFLIKIALRPPFPENGPKISLTKSQVVVLQLSFIM